MSEDSAFKRIRAARAGRQFPAVFEALAAGRLNLSAVVMLASHLTPETADELRERFGVSVGGAAGEGSVVGAAGEAHRGPATSTSEIAARFPSPVATTDVHHTST